jgi:hypothetical protein
MNESPSQSDSRGRGTANTRKERVPFGVPASRLTVANQDPNFVYRWINDDGRGRLDRAISGGYEFVESEAAQKIGAGSADGNSDVGSRVSRIVGTQEGGAGMRGYLMRIRREWYVEDQKAKQAQVDEIDKAIKRGDAHKSGDDNRYVPSAGISTSDKLVRAKTAA